MSDAAAHRGLTAAACATGGPRVAHGRGVPPVALRISAVTKLAS
jgi:hypothetical protein